MDATRSYDRDFDYDFFGFKTLERSYLLKMNGEVRGCPTRHGTTCTTCLLPPPAVGRAAEILGARAIGLRRWLSGRSTC